MQSSTTKTISKPPSDPQVERPRRSITSVIGDTKKERYGVKSGKSTQKYTQKKGMASNQVKMPRSTK